MYQVFEILFIGVILTCSADEKRQEIPSIDAMCQVITMNNNTLGTVDNGTCFFTCFKVEKDGLVKLFEYDELPKGVACRLLDGRIGSCNGGDCVDPEPPTKAPCCCRSCKKKDFEEYSHDYDTDVN